MSTQWKRSPGITAWEAEVGPFVLFCIPGNAMIAGETNPYAGLYGIRTNTTPRHTVWERQLKGVDVPELMRLAEAELRKRLLHTIETFEWVLDPL